MQQALGATGPLALAASKFVSSNLDNKSKLPIIWALCYFLSKLAGSGGILRHIISNLRLAVGGVFNQRRQEDAHEFLMALTDKCKTEGKEYFREGMFSLTQMNA